MKELENDKVIGRGRPREHPKGLYKKSPMGDDVTSGQKAPLGWILRNFRLRIHVLLLVENVVWKNIRNNKNKLKKNGEK